MPVKILTMVAGNTAPDAAYIHPQWLASMAGKGALVPLDPYMKDPKVNSTDLGIVNASLGKSTGQTGSMFGASSRYLKRAYDYRSILGKLIRDHFGATQNQLNRIIPGYAVTGERLLNGGTSTVDLVPIIGEPNIV